MKETSDFNDDTEEEVQKLESDVELMVESDNSDDSSIRSDRASLHSQHSTTENRDWKRVRRRLKATHSNRATNAKKGIKGRTLDGKKSKVVLSMFRDSKKEGALEYADWRAEVEEYIKKGYEDNKIKDAMLFFLEGKARRNSQSLFFFTLRCSGLRTCTIITCSCTRSTFWRCLHIFFWSRLSFFTNKSSI